MPIEVRDTFEGAETVGPHFESLRRNKLDQETFLFRLIIATVLSI